MTEKKSEDLTGSKKDGQGGESLRDRPDMVHVNDRPVILHINDGSNAQESEKISDLKRVKKVRDEPCDLQTERGGLKVKDSDFKTK